jgi:hypothetical protein
MGGKDIVQRLALAPELTLGLGPPRGERNKPAHWTRSPTLDKAVRPLIAKPSRPPARART